MLRETRVKVELVEELQLLVGPIEVLLHLDHLLQLFLHLLPHDSAPLPNRPRLNLVFLHLCRLDKGVDINHFPRIALQSLEYLSEILASHQIFLHKVK